MERNASARNVAGRPGQAGGRRITMGKILFRNISKTYSNGVEALHGLDLEIPDAAFAVIVGPSGCGKTTVLRLLAGLEKPTGGEIYMDGERIDGREPRDRNIAMVFQSYALYPHMTVEKNLSFGMILRKEPKESIAERVAEVASLLDITKLLDRKPAQLSGGERQRVALGRAIIRNPSAYLYDEPLSSLDARLRMEMRYMIKRLHLRMRTTTIYVTHDQVEAMTIGELLIVMKEGRIHQVGTPQRCYDHPEDTFVASFLGSPPMNLLPARVDPSSRSLYLEGCAAIELPSGLDARILDSGEREIVLGLRPEDLRIAARASSSLRLRGRIMLTEPLGSEKLLHVRVGGADLIIKGGREPLEEGSDIDFTVDTGRVHCFSASTGRNLFSAATG